MHVLNKYELHCEIVYCARYTTMLDRILNFIQLLFYAIEQGGISHAC